MKTKKYFFIALSLVSLFSLSFLFSVEVNAAGGVIQNPLGDVVDVRVLVSKALSFIAEVGAVFCVLALIWAGFLYVKARGNPKEISTAHTVLKNVIIGIILVLGAQLIASVITGTISALTN